MPSRSPSLSSKPERLQSAVTERAYKASTLTARALNVMSLLTAYQAELCQDYGWTQLEQVVWDKIPVITNLCLRVQSCTVRGYREGHGHPHFLIRATK